MQIYETLKKLNFTSNEIKIYLCLLEFGSQKVGKITKATKIDRSSCYNTLNNLVNKGFASYVIIGKTKFFQAAEPKRILAHIKEQESEFRRILPKLQAKHKTEKLEGQVRLFKGEKGIKTIFNNILEESAENYVFGSEGQFSEKLPFYSKHFEKRKKEKKIKTKTLLRKERKTNLNDTYTQYRYLPNIEKSPVVTNIYADKIAIIIWTTNPEGIIIENKKAAKAYKSFFNFMWNNATKN
jgi:sugar-specific transcriptional regulator TrmB